MAQEWFNLAAHFKAKELCHLCAASMDDYLNLPNRLNQLERRDPDAFRAKACKRGEKSGKLRVKDCICEACII